MLLQDYAKSQAAFQKRVQELMTEGVITQYKPDTVREQNITEGDAVALRWERSDTPAGTVGIVTHLTNYSATVMFNMMHSPESIIEHRGHEIAVKFRIISVRREALALVKTMSAEESGELMSLWRRQASL